MVSGGGAIWVGGVVGDVILWICFLGEWGLVGVVGAGCMV